MTYENTYETPSGGGKTPLLTIWRDIITAPSVETFARYLPEADLNRGVLWLAVVILITSLVNVVTLQLNQIHAGGLADFWEMLERTLPPEMARELPPLPDLPILPAGGAGTSLLSSLFCGIPASLVLGLMFAFLWVGLVHLAARLLKGQGIFTETFFLYAIVATLVSVLLAGVQLVNVLVGLIPILGAILGFFINLLSLLLSIGSLVLYAMGVAAAQRFTLGRGLAAVLLPFVALTLVLCCAAIGIGLLVAFSFGTLGFLG